MPTKIDDQRLDAASAAKHPQIAAYAGRAAGELPVLGYAATMGFFVTGFGTLVLVARIGRRLPRRIAFSDILLLGIATHTLSRVLTSARVAIPLRVPFTRYEGSDGAGQVKERPRGGGLRRAIGSLVTCPFCLGPWVATSLCAGLLFAPRATRLATSVFAMVAVSDFLHQGYAAARRASPKHARATSR